MARTLVQHRDHYGNFLEVYEITNEIERRDLHSLYKSKDLDVLEFDMHPRTNLIYLERDRDFTTPVSEWKQIRVPSTDSRITNYHFERDHKLVSVELAVRDQLNKMIPGYIYNTEVTEDWPDGDKTKIIRISRDMEIRDILKDYKKDENFNPELWNIHIDLSPLITGEVDYMWVVINLDNRSIYTISNQSQTSGFNSEYRVLF